ncbi:hypothetical protein DK762_11890 [Salmonella enterica subsp. houtenae]|nr:hypothetical protein [Salmonella enterica]ECI3630992.1 hypothetical protein [Salmonella enterica subsp. houtenae]ECI3707473.1 hypothetical protein [Salmonella enterica subsp. houtenae]MLR84956.1 hypothetical protein [Salmonella enterica subsp. houtenae]
MRRKVYCRSSSWGIRPECLMALCLSGLRSCVVGRIRRHTSHPAHCRLIAYSVRVGYAIRQNGFRRDNKQKHCRSSAFYVVSSGKPREVLPDED